MGEYDDVKLSFWMDISLYFSKPKKEDFFNAFNELLSFTDLTFKDFESFKDSDVKIKRKDVPLIWNYLNTGQLDKRLQHFVDTSFSCFHMFLHKNTEIFDVSIYSEPVPEVSSVWSMDMMPVVDESNEPFLVNWIARFSEIFNVKVGGALLEKVADLVEFDPHKTPEYCEWILVLGPELKKYVDPKKIKKRFDVISLKNGGILIHEDLLGLKGEEQIDELTDICKELPKDLSFLWKKEKS